MYLSHPSVKSSGNPPRKIMHHVQCVENKLMPHIQKKKVKSNIRSLKKKIKASRDSNTRPQDSWRLAYVFVVF